MQLDIFTDSYPVKPGYRDHDTSKAAAESIEPIADVIRERVYLALINPMTDWELAEAVGLPFETVQPRRSELVADGRVVFSGEYGISGRSHKRVKKWRKV